MFPEYRDLISKLKQEDAHFARLFEEHNELDDKITGLVNNVVTSGAEEIEELKKPNSNSKTNCMPFAKSSRQIIKNLNKAV